LLYHYPAVLLGLARYMLPFAVLLLAPAIVAIDEEVELASESLGASWPRAFWHVVLPMARLGLVGAGLVVFTITLTDYALPDILGGGTNDFVANAIYDAFFQISDAGLGSALAVILVLLGSTMFILAFNEFIVSPLLTDARIVTLPVLIYNSIRSILTPDLAAVSVVYIVIALAAIWLLDRLVGLDVFLRSR
jgi:putative spermidine/putrescine transport system permease protein